jgi:hypothetical protein
MRKETFTSRITQQQQQQQYNQQEDEHDSHNAPLHRHDDMVKTAKKGKRHCHSPSNLVVLERPLPCKPLAEGCPVPAGQAHACLALTRLACQDGLQPVLSLLEALQLHTQKHIGERQESAHTDVRCLACQDGLQPVLSLLEALNCDHSRTEESKSSTQV